MSVKQPLVALEHVSHIFRLEQGTELQVLKNINVAIQEGEVVSFLGPSGCGKTTCLKIMSGLLRPTTGRVLASGKPLDEINYKMAFVFQNFALLPWYTVEQNIEVGLFG